MAKKEEKKTGKHPGGRPPKYTDVEVMQQKIDAYFVKCDQEKRPYTITGLGLALDMDRDSLLNYGKKEKFFGTIKKAKAKCENFAEEKLYSGQVVAGVIFNLKNNYNWKDKSEVDTKHSGEVQFINKVPRPKE